MGGVNKWDDLAARLASEANPSVIRAYHGSPHDFDRFDASKIGTGEGAQAYGHGLYFAGNEGVARSYRDITPAKLPPEAEELHQQIKHLFKQHADLTGELQMAADTDGTFAVGWGRIKDPPEVAKAKILPQLASVNQQLSDVQGRMHKLLHNRRGHMYEVEIGQPEEAMLDFDVPLSQQSDVVKSGLANIDPRRFGVVPHDVGGSYGGLRWKTPWDTLIGHPVSGKSPDSLTFLDTALPTRYSRNVYEDLAAMTKSAPRAAAVMREAGIPGIRYLDQGSRTAGEGTHNYVVFPGAEDSIRILRKYAIPGAVGTGVASQYEEER